MNVQPQRPARNTTLADLPDDAVAALAPLARLAALGELTGDVVHAANNALFGILAQVELLLADAEPGSPFADRLALVREAGLDLKELVRGLGSLGLAGDGSGAARLDEETRAVAELLRRVARRRLDERYPESPLAVAAGREDVRQIVAHVLLHAVAATDREGTVAIDVVAAGRDAVLRVSGERVAEDPVAALGVRVARVLAERHGGSLEPEGRDALRLRLPGAGA